MNKVTGPAPATPYSQPQTVSLNYPFRYGCQAPGIKTRATETVTVRKGHYEPIATSFKHDGFNYRQITREDDIAIYEQKWTGCEDPSIAYEVIRIHRHEAKTFPSGKSYPVREAYPPSEAWGVDGFTLIDKDAAFNKFQQMSSAEPAPKLEQIPEAYWDQSKQEPKHNTN